MDNKASDLDRRSFLMGAAATAAVAAIPAVAQAAAPATSAGGVAGAKAPLDAMAWAAQLRSGEVTALEALEVAIARVEAAPKLNAVVIQDYDLARYHAKKLSALGAAARTAAAEKAPLWGVPFLVKDLNQYLKGTVTTNGCRFYKGAVADYSSTLVERYQAAGVNIFGKTASPEFGQTPTTESLLYGKTRNPWNGEHSAGGSSGGAAAIVGAGILPVAHASDGGGSIRIPASHCGVFGLKPSRGRLPAGPMAMEGWMGLSMNHVVSRTVRDSALLLDLTAGPEAGSRIYAPRDVQGTYVQALQRPQQKLRIAVWRKNHFGVPVDPQCLAALEKAVKACQALGHEVTEEMPQLPIGEMFAGTGVMTSVGMLTSVKAREKQLGRAVTENDIEPINWISLQRAKTTTAEQMFNARAIFDTAGRMLDQFFQKYDLILSPVTVVPAPKLGVLSLDQSFDKFAEAAMLQAPYTAIFNMTGQPAMSVPMHHTPENVPVGAHFAAPYGYEGRLLNLAAQLEQSVPWANKLPDLSSFKA